MPGCQTRSLISTDTQASDEQRRNRVWTRWASRRPQCSLTPNAEDWPFTFESDGEFFRVTIDDAAYR